MRYMSSKVARAQKDMSCRMSDGIVQDSSRYLECKESIY